MDEVLFFLSLRLLLRKIHLPRQREATFYHKFQIKYASSLENLPTDVYKGTQGNNPIYLHILQFWIKYASSLGNLSTDVYKGTRGR